MEGKIDSFISSNSCLTLCTCIDNIPNCCNCFYAYLPEYHSLIIKSKRGTAHVDRALLNHKVAGTISGDISKVGNIKGIQFAGNFIEPPEKTLESCKKAYYRKYPFALAMSGDLWLVELTFIKLTDNTLGFGNKLIWQKEN